MAQTRTQFGKFFRPTVQRTDKIIATRNDKNARDIYRGHKWFASCERFCERWDQKAFDPDYPSKTLAYFAPMLRQISSRPPFDPAIVNADSPS